MRGERRPSILHEPDLGPISFKALPSFLVFPNPQARMHVWLPQPAGTHVFGFPNPQARMHVWLRDACS